MGFFCLTDGIDIKKCRASFSPTYFKQNGRELVETLETVLIRVCINKRLLAFITSRSFIPCFTSACVTSTVNKITPTNSAATYLSTVCTKTIVCTFWNIFYYKKSLKSLIENLKACKITMLSMKLQNKLLIEKKLKLYRSFLIWKQDFCNNFWF